MAIKYVPVLVVMAVTLIICTKKCARIVSKYMYLYMTHGLVECSQFYNDSLGLVITQNSWSRPDCDGDHCVHLPDSHSAGDVRSWETRWSWRETLSWTNGEILSMLLPMFLQYVLCGTSQCTVIRYSRLRVWDGFLSASKIIPASVQVHLYDHVKGRAT